MLSHHYFKYFHESFPILLLLVVPLCAYYTFCAGPQFLNALLHLFILFSLCISVWKVAIDTSSSLGILFLAMSSLPLRRSFLLESFWFLAFSFGSFLEFPTLCYITFCSSILSTFSHWDPLHITHSYSILNSWSDHSKFHGISESVSDVCFVSRALGNQIEATRPLMWGSMHLHVSEASISSSVLFVSPLLSLVLLIWNL